MQETAYKPPKTIPIVLMFFMSLMTAAIIALPISGHAELIPFVVIPLFLLMFAVTIVISRREVVKGMKDGSLSREIYDRQVEKGNTERPQQTQQVYASGLLVDIYRKLKKNRAAVNYPSEPHPFESTGMPEQQESAVIAEDAEKQEIKTASVPKPVRQKNDSSIEITGITTAELASFSVYIDGKVMGYISSVRATFSAPSGMHEVIIYTNDAEKRQIYKDNILLNTDKNITIARKVRRYSVTIQ